MTSSECPRADPPLNLLEDDPPTVHTFSDVVIFSIYVLASIMVNGVLIEIDGGLVVHLQDWCSRLLTDEILQEPSQPDNLTCTSCCCNVLGPA
jgi:hypothetical protein